MLLGLEGSRVVLGGVLRGIVFVAGGRLVAGLVLLGVEGRLVLDGLVSGGSLVSSFEFAAIVFVIEARTRQGVDNAVLVGQSSVLVIETLNSSALQRQVGGVFTLPVVSLPVGVGLSEFSIVDELGVLPDGVGLGDDSLLLEFVIGG